MNLLTYYLNSQLREAGFPDDLELYYSLSYNQGDGVAFYGQLSADDCSRLYRIFNPNKTEKEYRRFDFMINEFYKIDSIEIKKTKEFHLYNHYNTMYPYFDTYPSFNDVDSCSRILFEDLLEEFDKDLSQYIINTSKGLERLGYALLEKDQFDEEYRKIDTKEFKIKAFVRPFDTLNRGWLEPFHYDIEEDDILEKILVKDYFLYEIEVEIRNRYTDMLINSEIHQVFTDKKYLRSLARKTISISIGMVRLLQQRLNNSLKPRM